jgi:hypothetical protein
MPSGNGKHGNGKPETTIMFEQGKEQHTDLINGYVYIYMVQPILVA